MTQPKTKNWKQDLIELIWKIQKRRGEICVIELNPLTEFISTLLTQARKKQYDEDFRKCGEATAEALEKQRETLLKAKNLPQFLKDYKNDIERAKKEAYEKGLTDYSKRCKIAKLKTAKAGRVMGEIRLKEERTKFKKMLEGLEMRLKDRSSFYNESLEEVVAFNQAVQQFNSRLKEQIKILK